MLVFHGVMREGCELDMRGGDHAETLMWSALEPLRGAHRCSCLNVGVGLLCARCSLLCEMCQPAPLPCVRAQNVEEVLEGGGPEDSLSP